MARGAGAPPPREGATHGGVRAAGARRRPAPRPAAPLLLLLAAAAAAVAPTALAAAGRAANGDWAILPLRFTPGGGAPPLARTPAAAGRRRLLRRARTELLGSVNQGYYTARLEIGTPARGFDLILDTGSSTTFVTCASCRRCGNHTNGPFDPAASSTSSTVGCGDPVCRGRLTCGPGGKCGYKESYKEGSSSEGFLFRDLVSLPGSTPAPLSAVVGCVEYETGLIYNQRADGIMGFGNSPRSMPSQLAVAGRMSRVFGLCYGFPDGGALVLGDAPLPPGVGAFSWTPLVQTDRHLYYGVKLLALEVPADGAAGGAISEVHRAGAPGVAAATAGGPFEGVEVDPIVFTWGYGTVMDSGSNMNYLVTPAFDKLLAYLKKVLLAQGKDVWKGGRFRDNCWQMADAGADPAVGWANAALFFPTLRLRFEGGAVLVLPPSRYLFSTSSGNWCLAFFDNGHDGTLIGGVSVRDALVIYDLERQRVGFADANCDELPQGVPPGGAPTLSMLGNGDASAGVVTVGVSSGNGGGLAGVGGGGGGGGGVSSARSAAAAGGVVVIQRPASGATSARGTALLPAAPAAGAAVAAAAQPVAAAAVPARPVAAAAAAVVPAQPVAAAVAAAPARARPNAGFSAFGVPVATGAARNAVPRPPRSAATGIAGAAPAAAVQRRAALG